MLMPEIDERNKRVLKAVVQCYIDRPDPVGSRYVTKNYAFNLSSATIRNIMADLEEMGFLRQPHTSAGRVPTDMGFRFFVDALLHEPDESDDKFQMELDSNVANIKRGINEILKDTTSIMSRLSRYLVFAVPSASDGTTLNRIQLFRYRGGQLVAVLMSNEGLVRSRIIESNLGLTQKELDRICDFLNSQFSGWTIDSIRTELIRQMSNEKALADILVSKAVAICEDALTFPDSDMIVSGLPDLLALPDFSDRINEIAETMEDKHRIVRLIDELAGYAGDTGEIQVAIGSEIPFETLKGLSIVSASYKRGSITLGRFGVIGPTRMDYPMAISMVNQAARFITAVLSK